MTPPPRRDRPASFPADISIAALIVVAIVPLLLWSGASTRGSIDDASAYQGRVRQAQVLRTRLFVEQLDEETGLRGYTSTENRTFLEPYDAAQRAYDATLAQSFAAVRSAGVDPSPLRDEAAMHRRWVATVAEPLLRRPRAPDALAVQTAGKTLVDQIRADDERMRLALERAATSSARALDDAVRRVGATTMAASLLVVALAIALGYVRARGARRVAAERERYLNEKRIADALQEAFLQQRLPVTPTVGLHAAYIPAEDSARVGGDWYDAFELPDGRLLFSIGDVAGHGLEAAIVMSRARQAILVAALHENDPATVLERANRVIVLQDAPMVTAICGYVDTRSMEVTYATAGHPAPILMMPSALPALLPIDGIAMGVDGAATYRTFVSRAEHGALLVLYTDGVIELDRDPIAGERKLLDAVAASAGDPNPALAIQETVFSAARPRDDVAILTLAFRVLEGGRMQTTRAATQTSPLDVKLSA